MYNKGNVLAKIRYLDRFFIILVGGLFLLSSVYFFLFRQSIEWDEGVYLATLDLIHGGFAPYRAIFLSQPPGLIYFTYPFYLLGRSLPWVRLGIGVWWAGIFGYSLWIFPWRKASIFLSLLLCSKLLQTEIWTFHTDALAAAFTTLAALTFIHYIQTKNFRLIIATAFFSLCAILTKLDPTALIVIFLAAITDSAVRKTVLSKKVVLVFIAVLSLGLVATLSLFGPNELWKNVVLLRLSAGKAFPSDYLGNVWLIFSYTWGYFILLPIAGFIFVKNKKLEVQGKISLYWLATVLIIFTLYRPLFPHHVIFVVAPICLLLASGFEKLSLKAQYVGYILLIVYISVINFELWPNLWRGTKLASEEQSQAISFLKSQSKKGFVVSDDGLIVTLSDLLSVPSLVDISNVRISSGNLTHEKVLAEIKKYKAQYVIFASGRLTRILNEKDLSPAYKMCYSKNALKILCQIKSNP